MVLLVILLIVLCSYFIFFLTKKGKRFNVYLNKLDLNYCNPINYAKLALNLIVAAL
jgi:hypothetical protein